MGFKTADMPPVDPADFGAMPFMEKMKMLAIHWGEYGFGGPKQIHMLYIFKLIFYVVVGYTVVWATTPGLGGYLEPSGWWNEPIFYQKLVAWTIFYEVLGLGASSGPLSFRFAPMFDGSRYWVRRGTVRIAPWPGKIPFTAGHRRTAWDVGVYLAILANLVYLLGTPGIKSSELPAGLDGGLINPLPVLTMIGLLVLMGLRDKVVFLASRAEQYLPVMFFFAVLPFVDMIIAAKIAMVIIWFGAGVSKIGRHTNNVVNPMMSNTPWITSTWFKRKLYTDFPTDMRPSRVTKSFTHFGGTVVEMVLPLVLLFSTNTTITLLAIAGMLFFHAFITSTFPLAVPLEWNVFFMFITGFLFWNYPAGEGYGVGDFSNPALLAAIVAGLVFFPVLGNLRPDLVSFLPSMRQYAGNWATGIYAFRGEGEQKLNERMHKPSQMQVEQLGKLFGPEVAEIFMHKVVAWRTMHTQGRGLVSLMMRHLDDLENYTIREGEFVLSNVVGWQFGDGHLLDERLIAAIQEQCDFAEGELIVGLIESQPIHRKRQEYRVVDAAVGVVERGHYEVDDAADTQPWLPDGPIPMVVTWTKQGYVAPEWRQPLTKLASSPLPRVDSVPVRTVSGRVEA